MSNQKLNKVQLKALTIAMLAVLEAVQVAGSIGAPGGVIYSALMAQGASYNQYQSLMASMVNRNYVTLDGNNYLITPEGIAAIPKFKATILALEQEPSFA